MRPGRTQTDMNSDRYEMFAIVKRKSFSVSKGIVFENHIKACVYFCIKRYLVEHNSQKVRCATKGTYLRVHLSWAIW